jgi:hypothetical protein
MFFFLRKLGNLFLVHIFAESEKVKLVLCTLSLRISNFRVKNEYLLWNISVKRTSSKFQKIAFRKFYHFRRTLAVAFIWPLNPKQILFCAPQVPGLHCRGRGLPLPAAAGLPAGPGLPRPPHRLPHPPPGRPAGRRQGRRTTFVINFAAR